MALIDNFPTSGWKNQNLKKVVQDLLEMEDDFTNRKAHATMGSILLTLGNVYKEDAQQISTILARPVPNLKRTAVRQQDPNPGSLASYDANCDTCPGAKKITPRASVVPSRDVIVDSNTDVPQSDLDTVLKQVEGTQTLVVSEEHSKPTFESPEAVWKFFSGDVAKLQEAATAAGVKNAKYDNHAMSLAKKIYNAQ